MSLRTRTLLTLAVVAALFIAASALVLTSVSGWRADEADREHAQDEMRHALAHLSEHVSELAEGAERMMAAGHASDVLEDPDEFGLTVELTGAELAARREAGAGWKVAYASKNPGAVVDAAEVEAWLAAWEARGTDDSETTTSQAGIAWIGGTALEVAIVPDESGPEEGGQCPGALALMRTPPWDDPAVSPIERIAPSSDAPQPPAGVMVGIPSPEEVSQLTVSTELEDRDTERVILALDAQNGDGRLVLEGSLPRTTRGTIRFANGLDHVAMSFFAVAFIAATLLVIDSKVLRRLSDLGSRLASIEEARDFSMRTASDREDEIGALARDIDDLIESLEQAYRALERAHSDAEELVSLRTEELANANAVKSRFLANLSHELRTPMNSIVGFTKILLSEEPGPLTDEQRRQLEMVARSSEQLRGLLERAMELSHLDTGYAESTPRPVDAVEQAVAARESVLPFARSRGLDILLDTPRMLPIHSDPVRIRSILIGLLDNAVKFSDEGSVTLRVERRGDDAVFEVSDTGRGIPKDEIPRLLEGFEQLADPKLAKSPGLGIGLALIRKNVAVLGGSMEIDSEVGVGTTVRITVPVRGVSPA
ncbi:MAG: hypothetical protein Kow0056_14440 [Coriobacteriia bacterium]